MKQVSVPENLLRSLELGQAKAHVTLLLRHSHRPPIKTGTLGEQVQLTAKGTRTSEELGEVLGQRKPGRLLASPITRCVETAEAVARGANWSPDVVLDRRLGDPGPFVTDPSLAGPMFLEVGAHEMVRRQIVELGPLPGMRPTREGVSLLWDLIMEGADDPGTIDVLVTHDSIIAVFLGQLLRTVSHDAIWPEFLDGPLVWRRLSGLGVAWMGTVSDVQWSARSANLSTDGSGSRRP